MESKIGFNLGLIGSILVIFAPFMFFLPIMAMPLAFTSLENFALAIFPVILGIVGVIGGRVGKGGKRNAGVLLLLVAGIGGAISNFIAYSSIWGYFPMLFPLVGGVLALFGGVLQAILILVSKDGENQ